MMNWLGVIILGAVLIGTALYLAYRLGKHRGFDEGWEERDEKSVDTYKRLSDPDDWGFRVRNSEKPEVSGTDAGLWVEQSDCLQNRRKVDGVQGNDSK